MIDLYITLSRSNLVKVFVVTVVVSICMLNFIMSSTNLELTTNAGLITLVLIVLIITSVFFGFRQRAEILVAPVATVFAFTQLRASMPGAPAGFGERVTAAY